MSRNEYLTTLLVTIPSTDEVSFRELMNMLGDSKPEKGDKKGWADVFTTLRTMEKDGLVEISWSPEGNGRGGSAIDSLILTEAGAARAKTLNSFLREREMR